MAAVTNGTNADIRSFVFDWGAHERSTIAAWIYYPNAPTGGAECAMSDRGAQSGFGFGEMQLYRGASGTNDYANMNISGGGYIAAIADAATTGTWIHRAVVYDDTNLLIYANGSLAASTAGTRNPPDPNSSFVAFGSVGASQWTAMRGFMIARWSEALGAAEIASLAKGVSPRLVRPAKLTWETPALRNSNGRFGSTLTDSNVTYSDANPRVYW